MRRWVPLKGQLKTRAVFIFVLTGGGNICGFSALCNKLLTFEVILRKIWHSEGTMFKAGGSYRGRSILTSEF